MRKVFINKVILSPADRNCSGPRCINKAEVLSRNTSGRQLNRAFTLVELLVVVLIIGILSAIAIPMYQGAVDKSHWSTMLPASKAIKDAEEAFKMTNGEYSDTMEHLDVQMNNDDLTFTLNTPNNLSQPNVVRVTNSKLDKIRLASYLDDSPMFAGQLHCEAKNEGSIPNKRGQRLCEKLLGGQELTNIEGYTGYLLDQDIDKATCDNANRSWSTSTTKCFRTDQDRCEALHVNYLGNRQCGFADVQNQTIEEEKKCIGNNWGGCNGTTINEGGICEGNNSYSCHNSVINDGGICIATGPGHHGACGYATVNNGGLCIATSQDGCMGAIVNEGGTCWAKGGATDYGAWNFMCKSSTYNGGKCIGDAGDVPCSYSTYNDKGVCEANVSSACSSITVNDGGKCIANASGTCTGTYNGTGCCEEGVPGRTNCPNYAPKC